MNSLKKLAVSFVTVAVMSGMLLPNAFAQTTVTTTNTAALNPISQWIVLSGLFGGASPFGTTATSATGTTTSTAATLNPISQWIVLTDLFNGPTFGATTTSANGTTTTTASASALNPISQWIVLSGLFGGTGAFATTNVPVDPPAGQ